MSRSTPGLFNRFFRGSISRKYATGYILILLIAVLVFGVSFFSGQFVAARYQKAVDELTELNELFVEVETTNRSVLDYYLWLRVESRDQFFGEGEVVGLSLGRILQRLESAWSRDEMDLCRTVDTYLRQGTTLMGLIDGYVAGDVPMARVEAAYNETQTTLSYINASFKDIYSAKLITTQQLQNSLTGVRNLLNAVQIAMLALAFLVCFLYYRRVVKGVAQSVNTLTDFAQTVAQNPVGGEHVHLDTGDEFTVFAHAFNGMLDTIQRQIAQIEEDGRVRQQLAAAEMENLRMVGALQSSQLRLLQSRINPHFLFNTLNMISGTAHMEEAEETAHLIEATAEFLRYNLGKVTTAVTLQDEIENTRNYVYIQQCRFGSRIAFRFETDPACAGQEIPCMILQPLVENSVTHGVGGMIAGGEVTVRLYAKNGRSWLEVEDNGAGIGPERLAELRASFTPEGGEDTGHIGLRNVYARLLLFFGGDIRFDIDSRPGRTLVRIGLPGARQAGAQSTGGEKP